MTVGTDGSRWGEAALRWAARHAWDRGDELLVLLGANGRPTRPITRYFPLLPMRVRATDDAPLAAFTEAGRESALLVLGCRGERHRHLGLGALVLPTVFAAECDTVVVRGTDHAVDGRHRRVTAMVGGSPDDIVVIARAADTALTLRADLLVLHAKPGPLTHHAISPDQDPDAVLAAAEVAVATLARQPATTIELVRSHPHEAVADRTDTDLLVVGRGGSGAVTRSALHLAPCPVMVVHDAVRPNAARSGRTAAWSPCLPWPRDDRETVHLERTGGP